MNKQKHTERQFCDLPVCAAEFIRLVVKKMRYRKKVRRDVQAELEAHFEDELKDCKTDEQREQKARQLIAGFGDVKLLAILLRRAKKRCRPLWRKALVRSFQAVGVVILYILICSAPLVVGRPKISVNYADWLNERGRAGRAESENAEPYYNKAVAACVKMTQQIHEIQKMWPGDLNDVEMQTLLQWTNDNTKALDLLLEGTRKPHYWPVYKATESDFSKGFSIVDVIVKEGLSEYRMLARALNWRSRYKAYEGNIESALDDYVSLVKFGRHQQGKGLLIEQMVGVAIEALAHETMFVILDKTDVSAGVLEDIQGELHRCFSEEPEVIIDLDAEKVFLYDYIQRAYTDDGKGGGRMLIKGLPVAVGDWKSGLWRFLTLSYPDRSEVIEKIDQYYNLAEQEFDETPWQAHQKDVSSSKLNEIAGDSFLLKLLAPSQGRVVRLEWRTKTIRLGLLTMLALARFEKDNGKYPENLCSLVELGYLEEMPNDPYSDGPLVYRRTDESFILYSFGMNLKDDGGKLGLGKDGRPRMWASDGDWIFWPVPESEVIQ